MTKCHNAFPRPCLCPECDGAKEYCDLTRTSLSPLEMATNNTCLAHAPRVWDEQMKEFVSGFCQLDNVTRITGVITIIGNAWARPEAEG